MQQRRSNKGYKKVQIKIEFIPKLVTLGGLEGLGGLEDLGGLEGLEGLGGLGGLGGLDW